MHGWCYNEFHIRAIWTPFIGKPNAECYAECHILFIAMLNVIMLNVIMLSILKLSIIMFSAIMFSVILLGVVAPNTVPEFI